MTSFIVLGSLVVLVVAFRQNEHSTSKAHKIGHIYEGEKVSTRSAGAEMTENITSRDMSNRSTVLLLGGLHILTVGPGA